MIPFLRKNKDDKKPPKSTVPHTAQESIPFQRMFEDGTCRVRPGYYTRTIQYQDINYQLAQQEDMLNQANGDRQILAKQLNISPHQLSYVTHSGEGEGLLFFGNVILPFVDHFPKDLELYRILTTRLSEVAEAQKHE